MNYTITNGGHYIKIENSDGKERNIHKQVIFDVTLNLLVVCLISQSTPLWLIDFSKDDIVTFDGDPLTAETPTTKAQELRTKLLAITASAVAEITFTGSNMNVTEVNSSNILDKFTGTNTPGLIIATEAGTVSGVKSVTMEINSTDATVLGKSVGDGYTLRWEAEQGKTLANLAYNPGTGTIIIMTIS